MSVQSSPPDRTVHNAIDQRLQQAAPPRMTRPPVPQPLETGLEALHRRPLRDQPQGVKSIRPDPGQPVKPIPNAIPLRRRTLFVAKPVRTPYHTVRVPGAVVCECGMIYGAVMRAWFVHADCRFRRFLPLV